MSVPVKKRYCVFGCKELGAYMHKFPHPERRSDLFETWMSIVGDKLKETDPWRIYKNKKICDYHFTSQQKVASHRLMFRAVPSVNLNGVFLSSGIAVQLEHNYFLPRLYASTSSSSQTNTSKLTTDEDAGVNAEDVSPTVAGSEDLAGQVLDTAAYSVAVPEDWSTEWLQTEDLSEAVTETADTENFSWQNAVIVPIETDTDADMQLIEKAEVSENVTIDMAIDRNVGLESDKYDEEASEQNAVQSNGMLHEGFRCNACKGEIVRFRYTCVQCDDFDLCAACEARAQHDHHYVLRVPAPTPHAEVQEMVARVRSALRLGPPPERVTADNVTIKSEEEESPWHEGWLQDDPLPPSPGVPTVPVTEVTSPPFNRSLEPSPKTVKKSIFRSRPAKRRLSRHQSDTSLDDTDSDVSYQAVQSSETPQNLQTIQSSRLHRIVVVHKDTGPQIKSSELEDVETQIVIHLPERPTTKRQYRSVVRKEGTSMDFKENEESGFSGDN